MRAVCLLSLFALMVADAAAQTLVAAERGGRVYLGSVEPEAAWEVAEPLVFPNETGDVTIQALIDGARMYLRLEWPDAEANTTCWYWRRTADSWERSRDQDDMVQIVWENPEGRFDLWDWGAARTNPVGAIRDSSGPLEMLSSAEFSDAGEICFRGNATPDNDAPAEAWIAAELEGPPTPDPGGWIMRSEDHLFEGHTEPLGEINPWTGAPWAEGDTVPGIISRFPTESQADTEAVGTWHDGRWILEIRRPLDTGDPEHDIVLQRGETHSLSLVIHTDVWHGTPEIEPMEIELVLPE